MDCFLKEVKPPVVEALLAEMGGFWTCSTYRFDVCSTGYFISVLIFLKIEVTAEFVTGRFLTGAMRESLTELVEAKTESNLFGFLTFSGWITITSFNTAMSTPKTLING